MQKLSLAVHFLFHPKSDGALELARHVHQQLNDDAIVPGLSVPTVFTPYTSKGRPPAIQRLDIAEHSFVVPLADNTLLLDPDWSRFVADVWEACSISENGRHRCVPIQLSEKAWPLDCLLYTSPSPRDGLLSRMPSSA